MDNNAHSDEEAIDYDMRALYAHVQMTSSSVYANSSTSVAKSRRNVLLNRYNNVSPYDEHRVVLSEFEGNDYINASIARGIVDPENQFYILAQGPLDGTIFDFWRMAWENATISIVMLNKLVEQSRNKCARYWPQHKDTPMKVTHHGSDALQFEITLLDEEAEQRIFVKRTLKVTRRSRTGDEKAWTVETRNVSHFHYIAWPDFGVPETPDEFATFFDVLNQHKCFTDPERPSIVHCSAGIGRTGTLILVDSLLKKLRGEKQGKIDLYDIVGVAFDELIRLRQFRMGLIQTADQLEFSIKAIKYLYNRDLDRPQSEDEVDGEKEEEEVVEEAEVVTDEKEEEETEEMKPETPVVPEVAASATPAESPKECPVTQTKPFVSSLFKGAVVVGAAIGIYSIFGRKTQTRPSLSDEL